MKKAKHQHIYRELRRAITSGEYQEGSRLPSEAGLVEMFATSRPTVARALRDLQHEGLIERRAGSGTYVKKTAAPRADLFGLLIPGLGETEIFEPICREMSRSTHASNHALLWGDTADDAYTQEEQAEQLCEQYIARKVSGVFFAPLEFTPNRDRVNQRIAAALDRAGVPVVLLDRCIYEYPRRSRYDLVGIDNRRAGYVVTEHLLNLGCRRVAFLSVPNSAPTVEARKSGYREALHCRGIADEMVFTGNPAEADFVRRIVQSSRPEAFVCANDITAASLMHTLDGLKIRIPADVRIVGIDDVKYAKLLRVPLT
ncbi:MAG TPA: GntR family transcriptional regulator, partial [Blastocatellia bacterium]|nr:GntR family transcriptional regulator [Blastocatellia bacterium]